VAHSFAERKSISCADCEKVFDSDVWVVVDVTERPDLVERISTGTLHIFVCPSCGKAMNVEAPLLVYRPGDPQPLLFSPAYTKSAEDQEGNKELTKLVALLRQLAGSDWRDEWVDEKVVSVRRALLPNSLGRGSGTVREAASSALRQALEQFLETDNWDTIQHLVETRPELMSDAADILLSKYVFEQEEPEVLEASPFKVNLTICLI
jgi:hypothetical protein